MHRILVLSDTHIGSTVGLWPEGFVLQSGHDAPQSKFQQWLWECWLEMQQWAQNKVEPGDHLTLVFNGDIIEGVHHRTVEIMSPNPEDQIPAALDVFAPLVDNLRPDKFLLIKGTECHSKGAEIALGHRLGGLIDPSTKQAAWDYVKLRANGTVVSFAHHCTPSSRKHLQATQHSIMISDEAMRSLEAGHTPAKVVCRAHRHEHGIWNNGRTMSVVTGAWQALTRHGHKVVPGAIPAPSAIMLSFPDENKLPEPDYILFEPEPAQEPIIDL
jgi:hypothetical protein